ncbi:hypothetical protein SAMN05660284_02485 [Formivibrio citricus]|uniref:Uncharacterized protein n=1 Tax=Formivibrio citricus TaxID=83765 RepID=A0A1I5CU71_9NEIS|nr:hypothetical protein [Formivibrio citricus]SFN90396.1 hypothetical protein SAMN05660284_02485 [Formivibrio citricus]
MAEKRQSNSDLESVTIRIPVWLKESLERVKGSFTGVSTMSDAVRFVMETGVGAVDPLRDANELQELQKSEQQALQRIVAKWRHGHQLFSRAELAFIAQWAHQAYMFCKTSNVQRHPVLANLQAFGSVIALRNELYSYTDNTEGRDRYYRGNLGGQGGDSIKEKLASATASLKEFPYCSFAEFASRCLEVALRDEPTLPADRLNDVMRPHLAALIKLALRAYFQSKGKPALSVEEGFGSGTIKYPSTVAKGRITVSPNLISDSMTVGIIWEGGNLIVAVNSFIELGELVTLVGAVCSEYQVTGKRFILTQPMAPLAQYVMRVGGVQIAFQGTEFDDLRAALTELMAQPLMRSEYERLAWIYGDI